MLQIFIILASFLWTTSTHASVMLEPNCFVTASVEKIDNEKAIVTIDSKNILGSAYSAACSAKAGEIYTVHMNINHIKFPQKPFTVGYFDGDSMGPRGVVSWRAWYLEDEKVRPFGNSSRHPDNKK